MSTQSHPILLLHGFMSTSESYFFPWLKQLLTTENHQVFSPDLPNPKTPNPTEWEKTISTLPTKNFKLTIAHSLGGTFALRLIQQNLIQTDYLIMISSSPGPKGISDLNQFLNPPLFFPEINPKVKKIYTIQSFDDPWTLPEYGIINLKATKGTALFYADQGHFETQTLPPELETLIKSLLT